VQTAILEAAGCEPGSVRFLDRHDFYEAAKTAFLVVRTGETAPYGNAVLRKGLVTRTGPLA
jgi:L-fucose mutarotase